MHRCACTIDVMKVCYLTNIKGNMSHGSEIENFRSRDGRVEKIFGSLGVGVIRTTEIS